MTILLAVDPGTRETGWAVFQRDIPTGTAAPEAQGLVDDGSSDEGLAIPQASLDWNLIETGLIVVHRRFHCVDLDARIAVIEEQLDQVIDRWCPAQVACGMPAPLQLPSQQAAGAVLSNSILEWAKAHHLSMYPYHQRDIRWGMLGRGHAAKEELAYVVMTRWGLLGQEKTTHEWNAIAVGDHHLRCENVESARAS